MITLALNRFILIIEEETCLMNATSAVERLQMRVYSS